MSPCEQIFGNGGFPGQSAVVYFGFVEHPTDALEHFKAFPESVQSCECICFRFGPAVYLTRESLGDDSNAVGQRLYCGPNPAMFSNKDSHLFNAH